MKILGIETSCDESAAAVVEDGRRILSNVIASQVSLHARYGGVVPEVASRKHLESLLPVVEEALAEAGCDWDDLAAIAVTVGPGLSGSLLVGLNTAKAIAFARDLPLVGVSHLEAHIYANWLDVDGDGRAAAAISRCSRSSSPAATPTCWSWRTTAATGCSAARGTTPPARRSTRWRDCSSWASPAARPSSGRRRGCRRRRDGRWRLPRAWLRGSYDFSFSGLKTAVLRLVREGRRTSCRGRRSPPPFRKPWSTCWSPRPCGPRATSG